MRLPLLAVRQLVKVFPGRRSLLDWLGRRPARTLWAVDGVSLDVGAGETLGLVGESGCGKSTLARCIVGLHAPTAGEIHFDGVDVREARARDRRGLSAKLQMIFQDPYASLNPRMTIRQTLTEVLRVHGLATGRGEVEDRVDTLLRQVGLAPHLKQRYPRAFSGGQRQRISIARALAVAPRCIVADEPVSSLDVSIQAQIINLLTELQDTLGLAYLFIAHDLNVVRHISHRVAVMYLGRIVEVAPTEALFERPRHPYTRALLSAIPRPDPTVKSTAIALDGDPPRPYGRPAGCAFSSRCPIVLDRCRREAPDLRPVAEGHLARCFRADEA